MTDRRGDVAAMAAANRARHGMPDRRTRDPWAVNGPRWAPWCWSEPLDLIQELELRASDEEGNELSAGVAIPGAPGTCAAPECARWKVWHKDARFACELCPCGRFQRQVAA